MKTRHAPHWYEVALFACLPILVLSLLPAPLAAAESDPLHPAPVEIVSACADSVSYTHLTLPTKRIV